MRRAAVSITSNIAEGFGRQTPKDKANFYTIARGSIAELQNQLLIAKDIKLIGQQEFAETMDQAVLVHKILGGLIKAVRMRE